MGDLFICCSKDLLVYFGNQQCSGFFINKTSKKKVVWLVFFHMEGPLSWRMEAWLGFVSRMGREREREGRFACRRDFFKELFSCFMDKPSVVVTLGHAFPRAGPPVRLPLQLLPGVGTWEGSSSQRDWFLPSIPRWKQSQIIYASPTPPCLSIDKVSCKEAA